MDDARLSRIENKVDQLGVAMTSLVRMEERVTTIFSRLDIENQRLTAMEKDLQQRLVHLERTSYGRGQMIGIFDRLFWLIVSAGAAYLFAVKGPSF